MTKPFHISLKAGERIYVNGAVLRVDRKVTFEFLNEVTFLLEGHVLQPEQTTTPLKQLYFIVQTILIEPANATLARQMFAGTLGELKIMFKNAEIREGLDVVGTLVTDGRTFEALKKIRSMFPAEAKILEPAPAQPVSRPVALQAVQVEVTT